MAAMWGAFNLILSPFRALTGRVTPAANYTVNPNRIVDELIRNSYVPSIYASPLGFDNFSGETPEIRDAYAKLWAKEPSVKSAVGDAIYSVASLEPQVAPADETKPDDVRAAKWLDWSISNVPGGWPGTIERILLPAILGGFSVTEKVTAVVEPTTSAEWQNMWGIKAFRSRQTSYLSFVVDQWKYVKGLRSQRANAGQIFDPADFVIFTRNSLYESPFGIADMRAVYRAANLIGAAVQLRSVLLENYSGPFLKGTFKSPNLQKQLIDALKNARGRGWIAVQEDSDVEVVNLATSSNSEFNASIESLKQDVYTAIRGAWLPFLEGQTTGAAGDSTVHRGVTEKVDWYLSQAVCEVIRQQIAPDLIEPNFPPGTGIPVVTLGGINPAQVLAELDVLDKARQMGAPVTVKQVVKLAGIETGSPGDQLLPAGGAMQPPGLGPPNPFGSSGGRTSLPFGERGSGRTTLPFAESGDRDVALAGPDGTKIAELLAASIKEGGRVLGEIGATASIRYARERGPDFFTDEELDQIAASIAAVNSTADLLGRSRIRERAARVGKPNDGPTFAFAEGIFKPLPPTKALDYFRKLMPSLGRIDVRAYGSDMLREAFTLAVATEQTMLESVQDAIARSLADGTTGTQRIDDILTAAGVQPSNPQYAEMVFRTNAMDAYNTGSMQEIQSPDMVTMFPVWQYLGIDDGRAGKDHKPHFDKYYWNHTTFQGVRGERVYNCRCVPNPIDKHTWAELFADGARVAA